MRETYHRYVTHAYRELLLLVFLLALFALLEFIIGAGFSWAAPDVCFRYIGCNRGFFGFDGITHAVSGAAEGTIFAILVRGARRQRTLRRHLFMLALFALCLAIGWELTEWFVDNLQLPLRYPELFFGTTAGYQLSRIDTFGDIVCTGSMAYLFGWLGIALRRQGRMAKRS